MASSCIELRIEPSSSNGFDKKFSRSKSSGMPCSSLASGLPADPKSGESRLLQVPSMVRNLETSSQVISLDGLQCKSAKVLCVAWISSTIEDVMKVVTRTKEIAALIF